MARYSGQSNPWVNFLIILALAGLILLLLFLPEQVIQQTAKLEREQMLSWSGRSAANWIDLQTKEFMEDVPLEISKVIPPEMDKELNDWLNQRFYTGLLWYEIFTYRMFSMIVWFLATFPFMMAASMDAYYLREIRKSMFTSQSPLRLRIGAVFTLLSMFLLITWLIVPIPIPIIIAPALIILMTFATWLWTANLQKRI